MNFFLFAFFSSLIEDTHEIYRKKKLQILWTKQKKGEILKEMREITADQYQTGDRVNSFASFILWINFFFICVFVLFFFFHQHLCIFCFPFFSFVFSFNHLRQYSRVWYTQFCIYFLTFLHRWERHSSIWEFCCAYAQS